ncbi:MAG TPA: hypothetical protein VNO14_12275 [Blastocatellia bacterium]|nr:hypothetical protein [Blastocatellia bacterium]
MHTCVWAGAILALSMWPQAEEPATKLEKFMLRKNLLLIKETRLIGAVPGLEGTEVRVEAVALSAPSERERVYGVRLVRPVAGKDATGSEGIIDFDEIASFQEALDHMLRAASEAKPPDPSSPASGSITELAISTRGGVRCALVQTGRQFTGRLQVRGTAEEAGISFGIGALGRLRSLLGQARERLVALGAN